MNVFMLKLYEDVTSKVTSDLLGKSARLNHVFFTVRSSFLHQLYFAMIEMSLCRRTKLKRFATVLKPNHTVVVAENIVKAI